MSTVREIPLVAGPPLPKRVPLFDLYKPHPLRAVEAYFRTERALANALSWSTRQVSDWRRSDQIEEYWAERIKLFLELAPALDDLSGSKLKTGLWFLHTHYLLANEDCLSSCVQNERPGCAPSHLLWFHDSAKARQDILAAARDDFRNNSQLQLARCCELGFKISARDGLCSDERPLARGLQPYVLELALGRKHYGRSLAAKP